MKEERGRQEEERGRLKGESGNLKEERRRQEEERGRLKGEDLRIRTKAFALQVLRLFAALPKETAAQILGRQLLRSGTAIGANYREAHRARSKAEFIAKTGICLAEVEETAYWLELLVEGDIVTRERLMELMDECNQLIAIFVTIVNKTKQKAER